VGTPWCSGTDDGGLERLVVRKVGGLVAVTVWFCCLPTFGCRLSVDAGPNQRFPSVAFNVHSCPLLLISADSVFRFCRTAAVGISRSHPVATEQVSTATFEPKSAGTPWLRYTRSPTAQHWAQLQSAVAAAKKHCLLSLCTSLQLPQSRLQLIARPAGSSAPSCICRRCRSIPFRLAGGLGLLLCRLLLGLALKSSRQQLQDLLILHLTRQMLAHIYCVMRTRSIEYGVYSRYTR
jgi:hypothetical protein